MRIAKRLFLAALLGTIAALLAGCPTKQDEQAIPWSRPADWEGRLPGMGG